MKRPRHTRRVLLAALCLIPVVAISAWTFIPPGRDQFATVQVSRGDIESSVTALGTLQPRRYVDVGAQASGQIRKIHVEAGDTVKEGQLLVEIDPSTQQAKLDASRFSIENLQAQLQVLHARIDAARRELKEAQALERDLQGDLQYLERRLNGETLDTLMAERRSEADPDTPTAE